MESYQTFFDEQLRYLYSLGHRPTGSDNHAALVDRISADLARLGLEVHRDPPHRFERWGVTPDRLALTVGGRRLTISSAWPYSGETGPEGVTAPLTFVDGWCRKNWRAGAGHIAVVEVQRRRVPYRLLFDTWCDDPPPKSTVSHPVISAWVSGINLQKAKDAGVLAVIAVWKGLADRSAAGQYLPFWEPYEGLPAVWVSESEADALLRAARVRASATLVVDAVRTADVKTDTVWAVSLGTVSCGEIVIAVTHTDGTNAVEENGHIGLLALAHEAVTKPHDRTIVFVFTTGHLRLPSITRSPPPWHPLRRHEQAMSAWLDAHPELCSGQNGGKTAVASIVIEHLGALEYATDPVTGTYGPTGRPEPELLYATTEELAERVRKDWRGAASGPVVPAKPGALVHLREGEPFFKRRIPTVALVTGPEYLAAEIDDRIVDVAVLTRQCESFQRLLGYLGTTRTSREELGIVTPPSMFRKALAGIWALYVLVRGSGKAR
jgi:hypothetical protein